MTMKKNKKVEEKADVQIEDYLRNQRVPPLIAAGVIRLFKLDIKTRDQPENIQRMVDEFMSMRAFK